MKKHLLTVYRLMILLGTSVAFFWYHGHLKAKGDAPVTLSEVKVFLPKASRLIFETNGVRVLDEEQNFLAWALRTSPHSNHIKGYAGSTDALLIFKEDLEILGVALRSSEDTPGHVEDVQGDHAYLDMWPGKNVREIAEISDLEENEIWGVSGATKTSNCMSESIIFRSAKFFNQQKPIAMKWQMENLLFIGVLLLAVLGTFTKLKKEPRYRKVIRLLIFLVVVIKGLDLLCLSLINGWMSNGAPWNSAPILLAYVVLLFLIPAFTRKQIYCQQICPHGYIQEHLGNLIPKRWHLKLSTDWKWLLSFIPFFLIVSAMVISIFGLPFDLADLEVFAAWYPTRASVICISLFAISILFSSLVPKGYCKYACPTGKLLEYVRSSGKADKFSLGDKVSGIVFIISLTAMIFLTQGGIQ